MSYQFIYFISIFLISSQMACASVHRSTSGPYELQIEDVHGYPLSTFSKNQTTYVLGQHSQRYNIRVINRSNHRIEAVITVDGRDAISGDLGDYINQRGYIVEPNDSVVVDGFRRSMNTVAAFRFTHPSDGYSARRGTPQHAGVIGVAIFKEKQRFKPRPRRSRATKKSGQSAYDSSPSGMAHGRMNRAIESSRGRGRLDSASRRSSVNNLGTRFGEDRHSQAVETPFVRSNTRHPTHLLAVYYDNHSGLVARGIRVNPINSAEPNPFPNRRFAPAP
ncbi:MAG: hypothetical protein VYA30_11185 [Myxococcota bacterium]|nr:hypothetical protein [Myxococcota bacterium]